MAADPAYRRPGDTYFLGDYRIVDDLGMGGMASVHLARLDRDGGFQKWAAVKKIHAHLIEDDSFVTMFLDEARVAASISHPNVAAVFDLGKDGDTYWIAMEYLHGEPLRDIMRKTEELGQLMPPEIACRIIADAAEGLHAAHELTGKNGEKLGLVHRDVTPHNLFVTYDGVTKVVDFGIAKFSSRSSSTRAGTLKGKLAYMSPEQVAGEGIDRRTDIFALGVVLWEMTTGQRLFRMDSDLDTLAKVQDCNVPRPSTIVRGYPVDLEKIVLKALTKNRAERYRTAREFSRALQSFFLRRGLFISNDEVSHYMHSAFQERIDKREAHMRWAAEVTSGEQSPDRMRPNPNNQRSEQSRSNVRPQTAPMGARPPGPQGFDAPRPVPAAGGRPQAPRPTFQEPTPQPLENFEHDDGDGDMPTLIAMNGAAGFVPPTAGRQAAGVPSPLGDDDFGSLASDDDENDGEDRTIVEAGVGAPAPVGARPAAGQQVPPGAARTIGMQNSPQSPFGAPPAIANRPARAQTMQGVAPVGDYGQNPYGNQQPQQPAFDAPGPFDAPRVDPANPFGATQLPTDSFGMGGNSPFGAPAEPAFNPFDGRGNNANDFGAPPAFAAMPAPGVESFGNAPQAPRELTATVVGAPAAGKNWKIYGLVAAAVAALLVIGLGAVILVAKKPEPAFDPKLASASGPFQTTKGDFFVAIAPKPAPLPPPVEPVVVPPPVESAVAPPPASASAEPDPVKPEGKPDPKPNTTTSATTATTAVTPPIKKVDPPKPTGTGTLTVVCMPSCDNIIIDGASVGPGPVFNRSVAAGSHSVSLSSGATKKSRSVKVEPNKLSSIREPMR